MNAPTDVLEQRLLDAFGPEAAEIDLRAREASRQVEMTGRLEARVKTESRERKAADADLSERVDKLTALLERHGILKADAT